jgi:hypothetical protein
MALDWAICHEIPHGGRCRRAESRGWANRIEIFPERDTHFELPSTDGVERTRLGRHRYFSLASALTGDSKKTAAFAIKHKKPWLHIYRDGRHDAAESLLRFISDQTIKILNAAGSRASKETDIAAFVNNVLEEAFFPRPESSIGGPGEG